MALGQKMTIGGLIVAFACAAGLWIGAAAPLQAQSQFTPVLYVNDRAITRFELEQRQRLLVLFNTPGDLQQVAREQLIEDRLRLDAARADGIVVTEEELVEGMEEFAGRANLTADQLIELIAQQGVRRESFEDFVRAGVAWRTVVRTRFGPRAQVTEAEVDRAIANAAGSARGPGTAAIEYAEYIVTGADAGRLDRILGQLDTCDDLYGVAKGKPEDLLTITTLPPAQIPGDIRAELDTLDSGEVSTRLNRGGNTLLLMLCGRTAAFDDSVDRDSVRSALINQRAATYANGYLAELKADAIIREP